MKTTSRLLTLAALALLLLASCTSLDFPSLSTTRDEGARSAGGTGTRNAASVAVGNNDTVRLDAGTYEGTLRVDANNATVSGAGVGRTVLRGTLIVDGNSNTVSGLTVIGRVTISGNTNDLSGADLTDAEVSSRGNNNRY